MSVQIYLRMSAYLVTFVMHMVNMTSMSLSINTDKNLSIVNDVNIQIFKGTMFRYFTCWTVGLQIFYAALGLYCDGLIIRNSDNKKFRLPKQLSGLRNITFAALVYPCSMVVATVFWSVFNYDRSLIYPLFLDKIISKTTNHILHTAIVPITLWEVLLRPRVEPKSHRRNLLQLAFHFVVYLSVLYYTYYERGLWLYPMFQVAYDSGAIQFVLLHLCIFSITLFFYYSQWYINSLVHGVVVRKKIE